MMKTAKEKSVPMNLSNQNQIGRTVFRAIGDATSVELPKIEAELIRQLDSILEGIESKRTEAFKHPGGGVFSRDTAAKMKCIMRQLFLHLQRALALNIAQSLSERLTASINEMTRNAVNVEEENRQLSNEITYLRERLDSLSHKTNEYEGKQDNYGRTNGELRRFDYEEISMSVDRLISRTHQATEVLAVLSKKYLELREGNSEFNQIGTG